MSQPGMVMPVYNRCTWKEEEIGSRVQGQSRLHSDQSQGEILRTV